MWAESRPLPVGSSSRPGRPSTAHRTERTDPPPDERQPGQCAHRLGRDQQHQEQAGPGQDRARHRPLEDAGADRPPASEPGEPERVALADVELGPGGRSGSTTTFAGRGAATGGPAATRSDGARRPATAGGSLGVDASGVDVGTGGGLAVGPGVGVGRIVGPEWASNREMSESAPAWRSGPSSGPASASVEPGWASACASGSGSGRESGLGSASAWAGAAR